MDCFYLVGFYTGTFEVRIVKLGACFMMLQLFFLWLGGFAMSSEMLHLIGAAIGTFFGLFMLRQNMVDCEGWDYISRNEWLQNYSLLHSQGQMEQRRQQETIYKDPVTAALATNLAPGANATTRVQAKSLPSDAMEKDAKKKFVWGINALLSQTKPAAKPASPSLEPDITAHPDFNRLAYVLGQAVGAKNSFDAQQQFRKMDQAKLAQGLPDKLLMEYVQVLASDKAWSAAIRPLTIVASHQGVSANHARLRLGQIQLKVMGNPEAAIKILQQIVAAPDDHSSDTQKLITQRNQLLAQASL